MIYPLELYDRVYYDSQTQNVISVTTVPMLHQCRECVYYFTNWSAQTERKGVFWLKPPHTCLLNKNAVSNIAQRVLHTIDYCSPWPQWKTEGVFDYLKHCASFMDCPWPVLKVVRQMFRAIINFCSRDMCPASAGITQTWQTAKSKEERLIKIQIKGGNNMYGVKIIRNQS